MKNHAAALQSAATVLGSAESVVLAFQALRDACSDEQWDELTTAGPLSALLDACSDLEYDIER